jgi:hypothetical protein
MPLQIPPDEVAKLVKICLLSVASSDELTAALKVAPVLPEPKDLALQIADTVPSIPIEDLVDIVSALYSISYVRQFSGISVNRFLSDLIEELRIPADLETEDQVSAVRSRLRVFLGIETLNTLSKAVGLQRDGERLYCESKIFSDIRPIFLNDASARPQSAVITHTLKIGYHEGKDHKEFFVILDMEDLEELREVIERAHVKSQTLRGLLTDAKLTDLGR